jgi:hypothetical protein
VQKAKITAWANVPFGEVWWHYPTASQSGLENDTVVVLNYRTLTWMTHTVARGAGSAEVFATPQLWAPDGRLYAHEMGTDHGGDAPFLESGPLELGEGDRVLRLQSLIPDEKTLGQVQAFFYSAFQPMEVETRSAPYSLAARTDIRESGRQFRLRLERVLTPTGFADGSVVADASMLAGVQSADESFRIGTFRLGYVSGGYR